MWLARLVASDSSQEHIDKALRQYPDSAVLGIGGVDLRGPLRFIGLGAKVKLATLHRQRGVLATGGWASDIKPIIIPKADVTTVLKAPVEWPADVVQLAAQKASVDLQGANKLLQQVALNEEWFPSEL